jgi:NitT/TauT family transport system ATP-binding protein
MTPRPGRILDVVKVDLPRPRDVKVLEHPRFIALSTRVRNGIGMGSETPVVEPSKYDQQRAQNRL